MKVINLFGGPGTGKSTIAAKLFSSMKMKHLNVELVTEFAKDLCWEFTGHHTQHPALDDQLYILGNQNRRLTRLMGKVDYVIVDSPIIMNMVYATPSYYPKHYRLFLQEVWESYDNFSVFLTRGDYAYQAHGRNQDEDQAREKDQEILDMLQTYDVTYHTIKSSPKCHRKIFNMLNLKELYK